MCNSRWCKDSDYNSPSTQGVIAIHKHQNIPVRLNKAKHLSIVVQGLYTQWKENIVFLVHWITDSDFQLTGSDFLFVFDEVNSSFLSFPPPDISALITWERKREGEKDRRCTLCCSCPIQYFDCRLIGAVYFPWFNQGCLSVCFCVSILLFIRWA